MGKSESAPSREYILEQIGKEYALSSELGNYAKKTEIPSLAEYAKKTEIPSFADYAKKTDLSGVPSVDQLTEYAKKTDLVGYVKSEELAKYTSTVRLEEEIKKIGISCTGDICQLPSGYGFGKGTNTGEHCVFNGTRAILCMNSNNEIIRTT